VERFEDSVPVIFSCHGLDVTISEKILNAAAVHLVSEVQIPREHESGTDAVRFSVIPNYSDAIRHKDSTRNVGIVGRLGDPKKNVRNAAVAALKSKAQYVHLWGDGDVGLIDERLVVHGFTLDKEEIYRSFDVLLSLSLEESFGMAVIEAMSAGIPCVLSNIPAFEKFADCPGVDIVDPDDINQVVSAIDRALEASEDIRSKMQEYWEARYSREAVKESWIGLVESIIGDQIRY